MSELIKKKKVLSSMTFEKDDKLERKFIAENFNRLFENTSQPFVVALDSPWGSGKTQFIYMWKNLLEKQEKKSVYINLWEEDFLQNPFFSLTECLIPEFESFSIGNIEAIKENIKKVGKEIGKSITKKITNLDINDIFEEDSNRRKKEEKEKFKLNLKKLASKIKENQKFPLIIFIDELDRCRPNYAIEFLEIVKHFFDVENIIFVFGIDMNQLQHSVKSIYGQNMNAKEYLRKFIDIDYNLPTPSIDKYIEFLFLEFNCGKKEQNLIKISKEIICKFNPSLREIDSLFIRLKLIDKNFHESYVQAAFLLSLKIFKEYEYDNLIRNPEKVDDILNLESYFKGRFPDYRDIIFWKIANNLILKNSFNEEDYTKNLKKFFSRYANAYLLGNNNFERALGDFSWNILNIIRKDKLIEEGDNKQMIINIFQDKQSHLREFFDLINKIDFLEGLEFSKGEKEEDDE